MASTIYEGVYYVESSDLKTYNPIAIRPNINEQRKTIYWEDTSHGSSIQFDSVNVDFNADSNTIIPDSIQIFSPGEVVTLKKLTLDLFNQKVKDRVAGKPKFHSDEELWNYYLTTEFQLY